MTVVTLLFHSCETCQNISLWLKQKVLEHNLPWFMLRDTKENNFIFLGWHGENQYNNAKKFISK